MQVVIINASSSSFAETIESLLGAIERRGLTLFAQIDHARAAHDAGLELEPEQVIVFGNPQAGTSLMQSDRRVGIDLPLRILVWREGDDVMLAYRDPRELGEVYELQGHQPTLEQMAGLLGALADEAAG
jgi:uncharacterized protein (DUF302 family)